VRIVGTASVVEYVAFGIVIHQVALLTVSASACSIKLVFLSAINSSLIDCMSWLYIRILALAQYTHRKFDVLVLFSFSANFRNNHATLTKRCIVHHVHIARSHAQECNIRL